MPHDQETIEQTKRDVRNDEQIYRSDPVGMIAEERLPPLRRRTSSLGHVFSNARLSDRDAEFQQLTTLDARSLNSEALWRAMSSSGTSVVG
jgi:hypothetical protein